MLETLHRAKLAKGLSHPVNGTEVTAAVGDIGSREVGLNFRGQIYNRENYFDIVRKGLEPIVVLRALYTKPDLRRSAPSSPSPYRFATEREDIDIYPVLSSDRGSVRKELFNRGLALIGDWFSCERAETWRQGRHSLDITWCPATNSLSTQNT